MATSIQKERYEQLQDEVLVELSHNGDDEAQEVLLERYKYFVRSRARSYFLIGADKEDIIQEGMIGLYKAIRDYRADKESSFKVFAELCIVRQIITAIKTATRQKHSPLNSYVSLNKNIYDEESERTLEEIVLSDALADPEEQFISRENMAHIYAKMEEILSPLEKQVLALYLEGKSYVVIAEELKRRPKTVDNALQRVKKKLDIFLKKEKFSIDK